MPAEADVEVCSMAEIICMPGRQLATTLNRIPAEEISPAASAALLP